MDLPRPSIVPTLDVQDYSGGSSGCNSAGLSAPGSRERSPRSSFDAAGNMKGFITPSIITTPTMSTPKYHPSPARSPSGSHSHKQYLQVGNTSSIFRLPKPQVKLLKKTASVKQLYNSVLSAIKTIASSRDDNIVPELTKTFFEKLLRTSDESPKLHVTKVKVKDGTEFGRHFCSEVGLLHSHASSLVKGTPLRMEIQTL